MGEVNRGKVRHVRQTQVPGAPSTVAGVGRWFDDHGWTADVRGNAPYCFADEAAHLTTTVRRIAHSPLAATRRVTPASKILVSMQAEGETTFCTRDGATHHVEEGGVLVCALPHVLELRADGPSARVEVEISADVAAFDLPDTVVLTAPAHDSRAVHTLSAVVIASLNVTRRVSPTVDAHLQAAVAHLAASVVDELVARGIPPAPDEARDLLARARALIDARAGTPGVTVQALASELGVTPRHLARVFRIAFAAPKAALTERRSIAAQLLISGGTDASLTTIAHASGFPSASALRYALGRTVEGAEVLDPAIG